MKTTLTIAVILLLILAVMITYLGIQRETLINPPTITGIGFFVIAIVFVRSIKQHK